MNHRLCLALVFSLTMAVGCHSSPNSSSTPVSDPETPTVRVVTPQRQTLHRPVGQPGFLQAFERTSIVAKIPGYVQKWYVDLGDQVRKGDVLAELWVPEMVAELKLEQEHVQQARKALAMARAQIATAQAQVQEAEAGLSRAEANHNYWESQSARMTGLVKSDVVDKQTQEEMLNQLALPPRPGKRHRPKLCPPGPCNRKRKALGTRRRPTSAPPRPTSNARPTW